MMVNIYLELLFNFSRSNSILGQAVAIAQIRAEKYLTIVHIALQSLGIQVSQVVQQDLYTTTC